MIEIYYYFFVALCSLLFSIKLRLIKSDPVFFVLWLSVYAVLSIVVRSNFDADIQTYAESMSYKSLSMYFIKEPTIWLGQRYLFLFLQDAFTVFVIFDITFGCILFIALRALQTPQYIYFSILIFFPFVLGMQNVYRQWGASILLLYTLSFIWAEKSIIKSHFAFIFAALTHNAAAVFLPMLFIKKTKITYRVFWFLSFAASAAGIYFGADLKSSANTGANLTIAYLTLFVILIFSICLLDSFIIKSSRYPTYKLIIGSALLSLFATLLLSSTGGERIAMIGLIVAYPIFANVLENQIKNNCITRIIYALLGFIPMLVQPISKFVIY